MPRLLNYDISDAPTVRKFFDSDAFIRGLMGPFGCVAAETEFLTPAGWKRIDAYAEGDFLLAWSPGGTTRYEQPKAYIKEPCAELILFDAGTLKMALSPEHRVPHWNYLGDFQISSAAEIAATMTRRTIPTTFCGGGSGTKWSHALIRFAVMMHADGHYPKQGRQATIEVHKERKKERIRQVLSALGMEWRESVYEDRPAATRFTFEPPYLGKHFNGQWWNCDADELRVVLDEIGNWDGLHGYNECRYFTTHKADADFIQYAAHATGRRAVIREQVRLKEEWARQWVVYIRAGDNPKNRASVREHTVRSLIPTTDGYKYCFTTSTGFWVVRYRDTVFVTGNSGKSSACIMEIMQRGLKQKPGPDGVRRTRWAIIRNTFPQLRDTTIRTVHQWFPPPTFGRWRATEHEYLITALQNADDEKCAEIELLFRALDRPDHVRNILSMDLTGSWVNEAREVPWAIIDALQGRVDRYPPKRDGGATWAGIIMDTNPPDADSMWHKFFEELDHTAAVEALRAFIPSMSIDRYAKLFKQPSGLSAGAENRKNQSPGYWHRLAIGKSEEWIKVYVHGQYGFIVDGKPVYPEYHDNVHCPGSFDPARAPVSSSKLPVHRGWDFGLTPACIFSQLSPRGQWQIMDELVATQMGVDRFSDQVLAHSGQFYPETRFIDTGDPAGDQRAQTDERACFDILRSKGIDIEGGVQTPQIRQESVRKALRQMDDDGYPAFNIHPRCRQLRKAMMGGYYLRKIQLTGTDRYAERPEKNASSHPAEAMEYTGTRIYAPSLVWKAIEEDADVVLMNSRLAQDRTRSTITGY